MLFYLGYFLIHLLFCSLYVATFLWWSPGWIVLLGLIVISSLWAGAWSVGHWPPPKRYLSRLGRPVVVGLVCAAGWVVAFPIYLTYRQWLRQQAGLSRGH